MHINPTHRTNVAASPSEAAEKKGSIQFANWFEEVSEPNLVIKREHLPITPSTQILAREFVEKLAKDAKSLDPKNWKLYTADEQTNGVGQGTKTWFSPKGNIYATFIIPWPETADVIDVCLTQVSALSVAETLEKFSFSPQLKWPNDVQLSGKKVCGILCEQPQNVPEGQQKAWIIGIGINVNMPVESFRHIDQPATSLKAEHLRDCDKETILTTLQEQLFYNLKQLINKGPNHLHYEIAKRLALVGEKVEIQDGDKTYLGALKGITTEGALKLWDGKEEKILYKGSLFVR